MTIDKDERLEPVEDVVYDADEVYKRLWGILSGGRLAQPLFDSMFTCGSSQFRMCSSEAEEVETRKNHDPAAKNLVPIKCITCRMSAILPSRLLTLLRATAEKTDTRTTAPGTYMHVVNPGLTGSMLDIRRCHYYGEVSEPQEDGSTLMRPAVIPEGKSLFSYDPKVDGAPITKFMGFVFSSKKNNPIVEALLQSVNDNVAPEMLECIRMSTANMELFKPRVVPKPEIPNPAEVDGEAGATEE